MNRNTSNIETEFSDWFASPPGQALLRQEKKWAHALLQGSYGTHLLQVGLAQHNLASQATQILHPFVLDTIADERHNHAVVAAEAEQLPIAVGSLAAVILPHQLEFSADPVAVLREVTHSLADDGELLIFAFSPWALWTAERKVPKLKSLVPCIATEQKRTTQVIPAHMMRLWLSGFGYEVGQTLQIFYGSSPKSKYSIFPGAFVIQAKKRTIPSTLIRPRWWQRRWAMPVTEGAMNRQTVRK